MVMKHENKNRFLELDLIRGICILLMILDHFVFFCLNIALQFHRMNCYEVEFYYFLKNILTHDARKYLRYVVLMFFFIISGICTQLSKNNLKRGIELAIFAACITLISVVASKLLKIEFIIYFGVIHFYAICVLTYYAIEKIKYAKVKNVAYVLIILISIGFSIFKPTLENHNYLMFLGVPQQNYIANFDYFPIFPDIGIFVIGIYIGKLFYRRIAKTYQVLSNPFFYPLLIIGRKGLYFYAIHIPLILVIAYILNIVLL
jgi:uncharacterized membrane protein